LPVCVGIGSTKTLAKPANHIAKKNPEFNGVCDLNAMSSQQQEDWFRKIESGEIWGIGRRLAPKLHEIGIKTVLDFKMADPSRLRSSFLVVMEKIIRDCLPRLLGAYEKFIEAVPVSESWHDAI